MYVSEIEQSLFHAFPADDAESWDHVGLSVGDPHAEVRRILVSLDATVAEVELAHERGCDLIVAHHPVYISAPDAFVPTPGAFGQASAAVYQAARYGVSIISMHTNLDRSVAARKALPALVGQAPYASLEHPLDPVESGLGALAHTEPTTLGRFARICADAFGTRPRVWGAADAPVSHVAWLGGSLGDLGALAMKEGADVVVCGEAGYHVCQDLALRGLGVILLGHDASEAPFTRILAESLQAGGVDRGAIEFAPHKRQWWTLEERGR